MCVCLSHHGKISRLLVCQSVDARGQSDWAVALMGCSARWTFMPVKARWTVMPVITLSINKFGRREYRCRCGCWVVECGFYVGSRWWGQRVASMDLFFRLCQGSREVYTESITRADTDCCANLLPVSAAILFSAVVGVVFGFVFVPRNIIFGQGYSVIIASPC